MLLRRQCLKVAGAHALAIAAAMMDVTALGNLTERQPVHGPVSVLNLTELVCRCGILTLATQGA